MSRRRGASRSWASTSTVASSKGPRTARSPTASAGSRRTRCSGSCSGTVTETARIWRSGTWTAGPHGAIQFSAPLHAVFALTDTSARAPAVVSRLNRADFLRRAGAAAATVAVAGAAAPGVFAGPHRYSRRALKGSLSVVQWEHVVPAYDDWFDNWATTWGQANDVDVNVDHVDYTTLAALAAKEARAKRGHDIFGFLSPPAAYQDQVIDHSAIVSQIEGRSARTATSGAGARTTRGRTRTSASPTRMSPIRSSGGSTSGTRSASHRRPGITCGPRRPS